MREFSRNAARLTAGDGNGAVKRARKAPAFANRALLAERSAHVWCDARADLMHMHTGSDAGIYNVLE